MSEWWTYRPEDLLLFSPRVYWRMFELHNAAWWPLHVVTLVVGLAIVLFGLSRPQARSPWIALAALWVLVGWSFLWSRYAGINWAIAYVAPAFWLQALLLAAGAAGGRLTLDRRGAAGRLGLLLAASGMLAYPLMSPILGRRWADAEVFGIAPDPTAIVTLGVLLATSGRLVVLLFLIPLLWLLLSGLTLHTMGDPQAWAPFSAAGAAVVLLVVRRFLR
ncbi:MAG: hypothetical protein KF810_14810 [Rhizobiaceae bacterium]|nr:hypothetical protein [Rhizobiaceae bacterium]